MRGRKPVPTQLKVLHGNPGRRPLPEGEPRPEVSVPDPPDHLTDDARQEWARISALLAELGLLTDIDRAALAAYCVAYGRWVDAERLVRKHGPIVKSKDGGYYQHPALSIANRAMKDMMSVLTEFGMTPSSRSRVTAAEKPSAPSKLSKYVGNAG